MCAEGVFSRGRVAATATDGASEAAAEIERNVLRSMPICMSVAPVDSTLATAALPLPRLFDADDNSRAIRDLISTLEKVVRLLPLGVPVKPNATQHAARAGRWDYREICDCQLHARRERTLWRRSVRLARSTL